MKIEYDYIRSEKKSKCINKTMMTCTETSQKQIN